MYGPYMRKKSPIELCSYMGRESLLYLEISSFLGPLLESKDNSAIDITYKAF